MTGVGQVLLARRPFCKIRSSHKITGYPFWKPGKAEVEMDGVGCEMFNHHLYIYIYILILGYFGSSSLYVSLL